MAVGTRVRLDRGAGSRVDLNVSEVDSHFVDRRLDRLDAADSRHGSSHRRPDLRSAEANRSIRGWNCGAPPRGSEPDRDASGYTPAARVDDSNLVSRGETRHFQASYPKCRYGNPAGEQSRGFFTAMPLLYDG